MNHPPSVFLPLQVISLLTKHHLDRKKHSNRAVKKTLTIPEWLNEAAMAMELNFSQILQEALISKTLLKAT